MKKIYFAPETKVVQFKVRQMLTTSLGFSKTGYSGDRSLDKDDEDEDSFGW